MRTPTGEQKRKATKVSLCMQWSLLQFMRPNAPEGGIINRKWDEEHWETKTGALQFIGPFLQPWSPLETISQPFSFKVATTARK